VLAFWASQPFVGLHMALIANSSNKPLNNWASDLKKEVRTSDYSKRSQP
jgi:hypothetical protein